MMCCGRGWWEVEKAREIRLSGTGTGRAGGRGWCTAGGPPSSLVAACGTLLLLLIRTRRQLVPGARWGSAVRRGKFAQKRRASWRAAEQLGWVLGNNMYGREWFWARRGRRRSRASRLNVPGLPPKMGEGKVAHE